jgi:hypothetical protein
MGRVARYKKIKACDPYSKQNARGRGPTTLSGERVWGLNDDRKEKVKKRSRTAERLRAQKEQRKDKKRKHKQDDDDDYTKKSKKNNNGFDLPPTEGDDFDLNDLVSFKAGSNKNIKRQKTVEELVAEDELLQNTSGAAVATAVTTSSSTTAAAAAALESMQQEEKVNRLLQLDKQLEGRGGAQQESSSSSALNRLPGESKNAYGRRVREETRKLLKRNVQAQVNPEKRQRKKDFLNSKKKKNRKNTNSMQNNNNNGNDDDNDNDDVDDVVNPDSFVTGEQAVAKRSAATVSTNATTTSASSGSSTWALHDQVERPPVFAQLPRGATAKKKNANNKHASSNKQKTSLNPTQEQKVMEQLRLKVQAQYEVMKRKRIGEGFHL